MLSLIHMTPRLISGVSDIVEDYDALLVDLWGCVVDGIVAFPAALDCLRRIRAAGRTVIFVTNVPRPGSVVRARLGELGVTPDCYDGLVTSGDATIDALNRRDDSWHAAFGERFYHIGANRNEELVNQIRGSDAAIGEADYILTTGFRSRSGETPEIYRPIFAQALARRLPMVCANPDQASAHGDRIVYRAGAVAQAYLDQGGDVRFHGKPHERIYRMAFDMIGRADRSRVLMIGDNLATDVLGAQSAGIDALWIAGGLHADEIGLAEGSPLDLQKAAGLLAASGHAPAAVAARLCW
jgi:HAD superfamily hydrolase (TIGR01459 family)